MLEKVKNPQDVKKLSISELNKLAAELRKRIIEVTSKVGGHVAPSLGATDLTVALLKVFDPLKERIVWDVGHQSYSYKILTERNDRFDTLRQFGGISGFNNRSESKYDAFGVGHSSTSISAALGITVAKEINKNPEKTIAIIGDGALTGGMAFEALNHAGNLQKDLVVILNDNNMSISKNVGALQNYLTNILVSRSYNTLRNLVWDFVQHTPARVKRRIILSARKFEENIINTLAPNIIFEDLGFKYLGLIDGHDIPRMVRIFNKVKTNLTGPVFIHVVTQKGKGYDFAEKNASKFHGLGPYEIRTGKCVKKKGISYSKVFGDTLCKLAEENNKIVGITGAMTDGTGLTEFAQKFPDRFFDVGIAEQHSVTFAGGLATEGIKPFVAVYSTFMQRALDQVIHDIALQKLPIVMCLDRAGIVGEDGATHHGAFDLSYLNFIPNMTIMMPKDAAELIQMLEFAANYQDGPIAIRYPRGKAVNLELPQTQLKLGKAEVIQKGEQFAILAAGTTCQNALEITEMLQKDFPKITPTVINMRFLKPLDKQLLESLNNYKYIFTLEENSLIGGLGSSVASYFARQKVKVHSFGLPDKFIPHGSTAKLKEAYGFTSPKIYQQIKQILNEIQD
jgi:1-deoxy-D-xylulose-5-phosphate synthase